MSDTKVLRLINELGVFPQNWKTKEEVNQGAIDAIQEKILAKISPKDIADHNNFAYSNSVTEYDSKPVNSKTVPELPQFMDLMPNNGLVLDLGAGHLRDTLYMIDPFSRASLNREGINYSNLEKALNVVPLEKSKQFLDSCMYKVEDSFSRLAAVIEGDFMSPGKGEVASSLGLNGDLAKMLCKGPLMPVFDGIWSCAAYMVHMAPGKLEESTKGWTESLKQGGIFAVSYINKKEGQGEIKFLASRSAPGEIKIFSHYTPKEVDKAFGNAGLKLINSSTGDYDGHGHVMTNFFGSAMYRKE
jgi:hypothetical protein